MDELEHTLTDRQQYWLEQVKACDASGKPIAEYAREQGIDIKTMYAGKRNLVQNGVLPRTRPVRFQRVHSPSVPSNSDWRVQLPNGVSVAFSGPVDARVLTQVLSAAALVG